MSSKQAIIRTIQALKEGDPNAFKMSTFNSCVAAWIVQVNKPAAFKLCGLRNTGARILGINEEDADRLFYLGTKDYLNLAMYAKVLRYVGPLLRQCGLSHHTNIIMRMDDFDMLPPIVRKWAAIKVLEILMHERVVDWDRAISEAMLAADEELYEAAEEVSIPTAEPITAVEELIA